VVQQLGPEAFTVRNDNIPGSAVVGEGSVGELFGTSEHSFLLDPPKPKKMERVRITRQDVHEIHRKAHKERNYLDLKPLVVLKNPKPFRAALKGTSASLAPPNENHKRHATKTWEIGLRESNNEQVI